MILACPSGGRVDSVCAQLPRRPVQSPAAIRLKEEPHRCATTTRPFAAWWPRRSTAPGPCFEFGSYQVDGQEGYANLRRLFAHKNYVGCDMRPGPGVDRVEDVTAISLPDESAGTVLCIETFEHVFEVSKAFNEVFRLLKPGGIFVITSPLNFRIHGYPDDYWRMTPELPSAPIVAVCREGERLSGLSCLPAHRDGSRAQGAGHL